MENKQWLYARRGGIGGSDAAVVLGLSHWKSPLQLYNEKIGEGEPIAESEPMFWGKTLEPLIRQRYADITGYEVVIPNTILRHPAHEWMIANLDGIANNDRVLEIKTARIANGWGEAGTDEIPDIYMAQVQHYMSVTGLKQADVAVLIGGNDFRIYEIPADEEVQALMIEKEAEFWHMVESKTPPEPRTYSELKEKFGSASKAQEVQADESVLRAVQRLKEISAAKKEEDELRAVIMATLKESDTLVFGSDVIATWKAGKPVKRFDAKAFEAENPEIYKQFVKENPPIRRLIIK